MENNKIDLIKELFEEHKKKVKTAIDDVELQRKVTNILKKEVKKGNLGSGYVDSLVSSLDDSKNHLKLAQERMKRFEHAFEIYEKDKETYGDILVSFAEGIGLIQLDSEIAEKNFSYTFPVNLSEDSEEEQKEQKD